MTEAGEYRMSKKLASTLKKPGLIPINYDDFSDNSPPTKKELIDILIREQAPEMNISKNQLESIQSERYIRFNTQEN